MIYSRLIAYGSYLPEDVRSNDDLAKVVDTSDEWIVKRTGIKSRRIAAQDETTSVIAAKALEDALSRFKLNASDLDGIIVATTTPDDIFPSVASKVQGAVLQSSAFSFDVNAVCCGFIYALIVADGLIKSGAAKRIAVIGAEVMSRIMDWNDRSTCVLFGDGAGVFILEASEELGILASNFYSDGRYGSILSASYVYDNIGVPSPKVHMEGKEVFRHAVSKMIESSEDVLKKGNKELKDVDWLIPHQANHRILAAVAEKIGIDESKLVSTVAKHANTSAASIPLAFVDCASRGLIKSGQVVLMPAVGGGLTWGSVLMKV